MKVSVGIICSVLGATIAFYLAIISLVTLPTDVTARWFAIAGITALSLVAGLLINGMSMQDYFKVSRAYNTLMSRLSPLLYSGIEDVLHRRIETLNVGRALNLGVAAPINGFYRVVGATYPADHPMRQNSVKFGEGLHWYFADRKKAGYMSRFPGGPRKLFDLDGQELEFRPAGGRPAGVLAHSGDAKWRYYKPIFEKSTATPWSNRVVGVINVNSTADDADNLFKTAEFQQQVNSIASEVSPYLDAMQVLTGEEML